MPVKIQLSVFVDVLWFQGADKSVEADNQQRVSGNTGRKVTFASAAIAARIAAGHSISNQQSSRACVIM